LKWLWRVVRTDHARTVKRVTGRQTRKIMEGGNTYKKADGLCWIRPEECRHKNKENKSFGQNEMGTCQQ
jgi:hypothetical protein